MQWGGNWKDLCSLKEKGLEKGDASEAHGRVSMIAKEPEEIAEQLKSAELFPFISIELIFFP